MATTFHRFSYLPRELRDEIWRFAIRTTRPGVHIFRVDDQSKTSDSTSLASFFAGGYLTEPSRDQYFHNPNTDCGDRNVSTYLIDGGLWTACKESRLQMEKRFQSSEIDYLRRQQSGRVVFQLWLMPETGYFTSSGGARRYFTVLPCRDLFVLQPDLLNKIHWDWKGLIIHVELSKWFRHIAIEYDPEWAVRLRQDSQHEGAQRIVQALTSFSLDAYGNARLWLVDHSIKRKKDAPAFKEVPSGNSTNAFYASDRKFLEVECGSEAPNLDHWECTQQVTEEDYDDSSIHFLSLLRSGVDDSYDCFGLLGWDDL